MSPRYTLLASLLLAACSPSQPTADAAMDAPTSETTPDATQDTTPDDASADVTPDVTPDVPLTPVTAMTASGAVVGRTDGTVAAYLGIPFAAPPVGSLRWRPPADPAPWTTPFDASTLPLACPQGPDLSGHPVPYSEDCLKLNVWTPTATSAHPRPVMVFVHGGGFDSGSGNLPLYNGSYLAQHGNAVVVTFNYRLGQLGYLAHTGLSAEDTMHHVSGNYGFMDQQAALRWVQTNAASFGGDPHNVTLFGESAGGISVCLHMVSPQSDGLFQRAISESGPCAFIRTPLHEDATVPYQAAEALGYRFASALGCQGMVDPIACIRGKTVEQVLAAIPTPFELAVAPARFQPNIDGYSIVENPLTTFNAGRFHHVPYLLGTNHDEGTAFNVMFNVSTTDQYQAAVGTVFPDHVTDILALYPPGDNPGAAFSSFLTDALFVCPARIHARQVSAAGVPTFLYQFNRVNYYGMILGLGVFHSAELPYVFHNFVSGFAARGPDDAIADTTVGYWSRFASAGDPNGAGATMWPAFTMAGNQYLAIDQAVTVATGLHDSNCNMLEPWLLAL